MKTTSLEAYHSIKDDLGGIQLQVFEGLQKIKKGSFRDIARACNLREAQVWKRLSELKKTGKAKETGTKICPVSGRSITIWEAI